jgi:hypothetical protein
MKKMGQYISIHGVKKIKIQKYLLGDKEGTMIQRFTITDETGNETEITCFLAKEIMEE